MAVNRKCNMQILPPQDGRGSVPAITGFASERPEGQVPWGERVTLPGARSDPVLRGRKGEEREGKGSWCTQVAGVVCVCGRGVIQSQPKEVGRSEGSGQGGQAPAAAWAGVALGQHGPHGDPGDPVGPVGRLLGPNVGENGVC